MSLRQTISDYRWPIYLGGILAMSVVAQGALVFVATRADAPRPLDDYYQRSLEWDNSAAVLDASRQLGWAVRFDLPADAPLTPGMPRPVDVLVRDRDGGPVLGLAGRLQAQHLADERLGRAGDLTEIPHLPGTYRTLLRLDRPGLWELRLEARQGPQRFVHSQRVTVAASQPAAAEAVR